MPIVESPKRLYGLYQGEVLRVRYHKGAAFIKAKIFCLSMMDADKKEYPWVTAWAPIAFSGAGAVAEGQNTYGVWFAPQVGDNVLIGFEQGLMGNPYCIGYFPHFQDMPTEFDNDDYLDKTREEEDRERPAEDYPEINDAYL